MMSTHSILPGGNSRGFDGNEQCNTNILAFADGPNLQMATVIKILITANKGWKNQSFLLLNTCKPRLQHLFAIIFSRFQTC